MSIPSQDLFLDAISRRRSIYTLSRKSTISDAEIERILKITLEQAPSTFASYTTRIVLLLRTEHTKFWDIVIEAVQSVTAGDKLLESTSSHLVRFRNEAYGTVLFFEDPKTTQVLEGHYPFLKDLFAPWSEQTSAIHQYIVWTAFSEAGLGVNLQHYNPLIDERTAAEFGLPKDWKLVAQMVFGTPTAAPGPRKTEFKTPVEQRLLIRRGEQKL
ncbi:Nitroreductase [Penicillium frequentans]|uniref:Nitroreductase n=1 Tax=Penicillium frequentans TaxID=3151616 RepID=A0AAD6D5V3_9EURO|nr:Nitroreductase [Penicillium glabrum]